MCGFSEDIQFVCVKNINIYIIIPQKISSSLCLDSSWDSVLCHFAIDFVIIVNDVTTWILVCSLFSYHNVQADYFYETFMARLAIFEIWQPQLNDNYFVYA